MRNVMTDASVRLFERVLGGPEAKALLKEEERKRLSDRARDVQALDALDASELTAIVNVYEPAGQRALALITQRQAELEAATQAYGLTEHARRAASFDVDSQRQRIRGRLAASASLVLDTFVTELRADIASASSAFTDLKSPGIDGHDHVRWTNRDSVLARQRAINTLIQEITNDWPYLALTDEDLRKRYAERVDGLPKIEAGAPPTLIERFFGRVAEALA